MVTDIILLECSLEIAATVMTDRRMMTYSKKNHTMQFTTYRSRWAALSASSPQWTGVQRQGKGRTHLGARSGIAGTPLFELFYLRNVRCKYKHRVKFFILSSRACSTSPEQSYIRKYLHTFINTYIHSFINTYIHIYIRTYIHTWIRAYTYTYVHS